MGVAFRTHDFLSTVGKDKISKGNLKEIFLCDNEN